MKRILRAILPFITIVSFSCAESLPPFEEPDVPLDMEFMSSTDNFQLTWGIPNTRSVIFRFSYEHSFDEVLADAHFFKGEINLHVVDRPELFKTIEFEEDFPNLLYEIPPNTVKTFDVYWDQSFDNGLFLWYFTDGPAGSFDFEAEGELRVFRRYNVMKTDKISFSVDFVPPITKIAAHRRILNSPDWLSNIFLPPRLKVKLERIRAEILKTNR